MKKQLFYLAGAVIVSLFTVSANMPQSPEQSVNGQGALLNPGFNGRVQYFSFQARKDASGNVSGSWESKSAGQEYRAHGNIDCLNIWPDGKTAILTGIVTQKVGEGLPGLYEVGSKVYFKVIDNGEGSNNTEDQFTDYYSTPMSVTCSNPGSSLPIYSIIGGNIQVKP